MRVKKSEITYVEVRKSPRFRSALTKDSTLFTTVRQLQGKRQKASRRGRPRKYRLAAGKDPDEDVGEGEAAETGDVRESPQDSTTSRATPLPVPVDQIKSEIDEDAFDEWATSSNQPKRKRPVSASSHQMEESHFGLFSEADPSAWDCTYVNYKQLPEGWYENQTGKKQYKSKFMDLQVEYLVRNFVDPLRKRARRKRRARFEDELPEGVEALADSLTDISPSDVLHYWAGNLVIDMVPPTPPPSPSTTPEPKTNDSFVFPVKIGTKKDAEEEGEVIQIEEDTPPPTPNGEGAVVVKRKTLQRCLCFYCDEYVYISQLSFLPSRLEDLEAALMSFTCQNKKLADYMLETAKRNGMSRMCKTHAGVAPGRVRLTRFREYIPDQKAIDKWRTRLEDDEAGKMMTFDVATELGLAAMPPRRCFYCKHISQHTVVCFPNATAEHAGGDPGPWIKSLSMGSEDVELILNMLINSTEEHRAARRPFICASHFRRSSFHVSLTAEKSGRTVRLRKYELPLGDELINNDLVITYQTFLEGLDRKTPKAQSYGPVEVGEWCVNSIGEIQPIPYIKLDLKQTLPNGTEVVHRFWGMPDSTSLICFACNVVRHDLIGIMDIRTPGLAAHSRKVKRPVSAFFLWVSKNKEQLRMTLNNPGREYMARARETWLSLSDEIRDEFEKKRSVLLEEYVAKTEERMALERNLTQLKPAMIHVRNGELFTNVETLEHVCMKYHSPFNEANLGEYGYTNPELQIADFEEEKRMYYDQKRFIFENKTTKKPKKEKNPPQLVPMVEVKIAPVDGGEPMVAKRPRFRFTVLSEEGKKELSDSQDRWKQQLKDEHSYTSTDGAKAIERIAFNAETRFVERTTNTLRGYYPSQLSVQGNQTPIRDPQIATMVPFFPAVVSKMEFSQLVNQVSPVYPKSTVHPVNPYLTPPESPVNPATNSVLQRLTCGLSDATRSRFMKTLQPGVIPSVAQSGIAEQMMETVFGMPVMFTETTPGVGLLPARIERPAMVVTKPTRKYKERPITSTTTSTGGGGRGAKAILPPTKSHYHVKSMTSPCSSTPSPPKSAREPISPQEEEAPVTPTTSPRVKDFMLNTILSKELTTNEEHTSEAQGVPTGGTTTEKPTIPSDIQNKQSLTERTRKSLDEAIAAQRALNTGNELLRSRYFKVVYPPTRQQGQDEMAKLEQPVTKRPTIDTILSNKIIGQLPHPGPMPCRPLYPVHKQYKQPKLPPPVLWKQEKLTMPRIGRQTVKKGVLKEVVMDSNTRFFKPINSLSASASPVEDLPPPPVPPKFEENEGPATKTVVSKNEVDPESEKVGKEVVDSGKERQEEMTNYEQEKKEEAEVGMSRHADENVAGFRGEKPFRRRQKGELPLILRRWNSNSGRRSMSHLNTGLDQPDSTADVSEVLSQTASPGSSPSSYSCQRALPFSSHKISSTFSSVENHHDV